MDIRDQITVTGPAPVAPVSPTSVTETPTAAPTVDAPVVQNTEAPAATEQAITDVATPEAGQPTEDAKPDIKPDLTKEERQGLGKKVEKKIGKLTKEKAKANERADDAMRRLQEAEAMIAQLKSQEVDIDSMSFDERIKHSVDTQLAESRAHEAITTATDDLNNSGQGVWNSKLETAQAKYSDYAQVVGNSKIPMKPDVATAIKESDLGAEMVYNIANNPELGEELYRASPIRAAMLLQTLEQQIGNSVPTNAQPVAAPVLATPTLATNTVPKAATNIAQMDMNDFMAMKSKQFQSNRRG